MKFPGYDEPTRICMIKNPEQEENQTIRHIHTSLPYYNISTLLVNRKSVINCFFWRLQNLFCCAAMRNKKGGPFFIVCVFATQYILFVRKEEATHFQGRFLPFKLNWPVYSEATHFFSEKDRQSPFASCTVMPFPFGPVKLAIFLPITFRRIFFVPWTGYRKVTLRSLRLLYRSTIMLKTLQFD